MTHNQIYYISDVHFEFIISSKGICQEKLCCDGFSDSSEVEKIEYRNDCGKIQRQVRFNRLRGRRRNPALSDKQPDARGIVCSGRLYSDRVYE